MAISPLQAEQLPSRSKTLFYDIEEPDYIKKLRQNYSEKSVGVTGPTPGYGFYIPTVGTSPFVHDQRLPTHDKKSESTSTSSSLEIPIISVPEQLRELTFALSLNKSQLAKILKVSRPTLYDWFKNAVEPNSGNMARIESVLKLVSQAEITSSEPLNARFVRRPVNNNGSSILQELTEKSLNATLLIKLLQEAKEQSNKARLNRINREKKFRDLGYDELSDEQKKQQLATNISLLEWPKA